MNKLLTLVFVIVATSALAFGQAKTIDNFNNLQPDTAGAYATSYEGGTTFILSAETTDKIEGAASIRVYSKMPSTHDYGTYTQVGYKDYNNLLNWGNADSLSLWLKVTIPPGQPLKVGFRMQVADVIGGVNETWIFQQNSIVDAMNGWVNLRIPLVQRNPSDGSLPPDSTGFSVSPANWGFSTNNKAFDADKIGSWYITIITTSIDEDSIEVLYDKFEQVGAKAAPVTIFNGIAFTGVVSGNPWAWGQSSISIENGIGVGGPLTNAIKWVQGNEWGNGWTGIGVNMNAQNMGASWSKDSVKFKMKCADNGVGADDTVRVQFEDGTGKKGYLVDIIDDGQWHQYSLPLRDFYYADGTSSFDSTKVTVFGIMAEADGVVGRTIYLTDVWTGDPVFDVIPPVAPTGVDVIGLEYKNAIAWTDVPNETGATYNVYYSEKPFTAISDTGVEDLPKYKIATGVGVSEHLLRAPVVDQNVTYYYGVTASDQDGNVSALGLAPSATTSLAKGVATIATAPPAGFAADGDVSEWESAGIKPVVISTVAATGQGHVEGGKVDGDVDLKVLSYLAVDANNLYIAFDVDDDIVGGDTTNYIKGSYGVDGCDLFIGLYDWRGMRHQGYEKADQPDYHFRFTRFGAVLDNNGKYLNGGAASYNWTEKSITPGYYVEAKIPFQMLADSLGGGATVFSPIEGMRIPFDYSINDNDNTNPGGQPWESREGILCYSPLNNDNAWNSVWEWSHTWIGSKWSTGVSRNDGVVATSFELSQNYPNPFNPTTNVRFSLPKAGMVSLKVYDVLGREVMNVLNQYKDAGSYTASIDASKLASGLYLYRLESGSFSVTKKMMLIK
ncbi:MAG: T9SS type A sorting domain-containing protein [Bacteroidota bacterium]